MTIKSSNRFGIRVALIALCALAPVTAFAQWEVVDNAANTKLENLDKIRNQNLIGAKEKKTGRAAKKSKSQRKSS
nr:hypothetical protein [Xanthomonas translucens]